MVLGPYYAWVEYSVIHSGGGVSLALHELGGQGQTAMFAHGVGLCARVLQPLADEVKSFRVVAPDLRGHGLSTRPADGDFRLETFRDDIIAVIDAQDGPVVAFGHSLGATALLLAAGRRPGAIAAICCYEPIAVLYQLESTSVEAELEHRFSRRQRSFTDRTAALQRFSATPMFANCNVRVVNLFLDDGFVAQPDGSLDLALAPQDEMEIIRAGTTFDFREELGPVGCPVTLLTGRSGSRSGAGEAPAVAELIGANLVELGGLSHFGPMEDPKQVAQHVLTTFLEAST